MQEIQECININMDHLMQYATAENGQMTFVCKICGAFVTEFEDSCP